MCTFAQAEQSMGIKLVHGYGSTRAKAREKHNFNKPSETREITNA